MKRKLTTTAFYLLLSVCSYSQNVLIDNSGDTLITITIQQMDNVFIELMQKDSLYEQAKINASKEVKYLQVIDSTKKDVESLKSYADSLESDNIGLLVDVNKKQVQIVRNRKVVIGLLCAICLQLLL